MTIDWVRVSQEILRLIVDLIVGGVGAYLAYRFAVKRAEIKRQESLREQLRQELLLGVHNPKESIELLERMREQLDITVLRGYTTQIQREMDHTRRELVDALIKIVELLELYDEQADKAQAEHERWNQITGASTEQ